jgi:uncharacterized protein
MNQSDDFAPRPHYDVNDLFAADAADDARAKFLRLTYSHLMLAILAFIGLTYVFLHTQFILEPMIRMIQGGQWFIVLIAFMAVSWIADRWARSDTSIGMQYLGLALYTVAEALIFVPLLYIAQVTAGPDVIPTAAGLTMLATAVLTAVVFITGKDFSFLRTLLIVLSFTLLAAFAASAFFGLNMPVTMFAGIGVVLGSGMVLYSTSNVLHHYRTDQYVAASLSLFAAIALLFWYILQLVMSRD